MSSDSAAKTERARSGLNRVPSDSKSNGTVFAGPDGGATTRTGLHFGRAESHNADTERTGSSVGGHNAGTVARDWDAIPPHVPHARPNRVSIRERFEKFVHHEPNTGCWIWGGSIGGHTYGQFMLDGLPHLAHRVSYEMNVGPIPAGLHLDHLCRNRECVCPTHLEPVTMQENLRRGWRNGRPMATHFHCGHPKTPENPKQRCRICAREWQRQHPLRKMPDGTRHRVPRATVSRLEKREGRP